jgi:hypothetical protein
LGFRQAKHESERHGLLTLAYDVTGIETEKRNNKEEAAMWDQWKKSFDAWEDTTARFLEQALRSPRVLNPAASALGNVTKLKTACDRVAARALGTVGLATKRDQERTLHLLGKLETKLIDLEEKLAKR